MNTEKRKTVFFVSVIALSFLLIYIINIQPAEKWVVGDVVTSACTSAGYTCGNTDGSGPMVSCSKMYMDYVGDTNLYLSCDSSGMAGCCRNSTSVAQTQNLCGSSNGQSFTTKPTANLCNTSISLSIYPGEVTENSTAWIWICTHQGTGQIQNCNANKLVSSISSNWTNTYSVSSTQFSDGYTKKLNVSERLKIKIDNDYHYVGILSINETKKTVKVEVSSSVQTSTISEGNYDTFDINDDNEDELKVTVKDISNNQTEITVKEIVLNTDTETFCGDGICQSDEDCSSCSSDCDECQSNNNDNSGAINTGEAPTSDLTWVYVVIIIIILIIFVGLVIYFFWRRKQQSGQ
jgi:hypothetical protein